MQAVKTLLLGLEAHDQLWAAANVLRSQHLMDTVKVNLVLAAAEPWAVELASYLVALEFPPLEVGLEEGESRQLGRLMGVTPMVQVSSELRQMKWDGLWVCVTSGMSGGARVVSHIAQGMTGCATATRCSLPSTPTLLASLVRP